jgi:TonB family protein
LLADSPARFPEALAKRGASGEVTLQLLIGEAGDVERADVAKGAHPLLNEAALAAAAKLRFHPAMVDGKPVPVRISFTYRFAPVQPAAPLIPPGVVTGVVRSKGNRKPIAGAVLQAQSSRQAVEADAEGRFKLELPPGSERIHVFAAGFRPEDFQENIRSGESLEIIYRLEPLLIHPYETVIRAERVRTEVSRTTLHEQELREVPGTMGDPFRVVMLLPGVSSIVSGLAYPVVRGSQPAATGYYIDGIRVPVLFHLLLGPAVVHPDFLETIDFFPGVAPAEYGRLLGGVVNGKIARAHDDRFHASAYADLINAGLFAEYPFAKTGTDLTVAGRLSYTPLVAATIANAVSASDDRLVLDFYDYQARLEQRIGRGNLRLFAFGSSDLVGSESKKTPEKTNQKIYFHRVDLRLQQPLGPGEAELGVTWGVESIDALNKPASGRLEEFSVNEKNLRVRAGWTGALAQGLQLQLGADAERKTAEVTIVNPPNPDRGQNFRETLDRPLATGSFAGAYTQLSWQPHRRLSIQPGVRVDNYHLVPGINYSTIEPRFVLRYAVNDALTLKGGVGMFHQPPTTIINLPVVDLAGLQSGLQRSLQSDVGMEWKLRSGLDLSADAYFNRLGRTVELNPFSGVENASPDPIATADDISDNYISNGYAYGLELLLRHPLGGNWFGWISYTLQRSTRFFRFNRYNSLGQVIGKDSGYLPFAFDQTHIFNAVLSYKFGSNWTAGLVFHFNTGRPESGGGLTSRTQHESFDPMRGQAIWVPADLDHTDRLPSFFRLDARVAKTWIFDNFTLEAYLDALNVTVRSEVLGYDYQIGGSICQGTQCTNLLRKNTQSIPLFVPMLGIKAVY